MKRAELFFNLLAIPIDAAAVLTSAVFAYFIRLKFGEVLPILFTIDTLGYLQSIILVMPFLLLLFAFYGLYNIRSTDRLGNEVLKITAATTTALMLVVLVFFFNRDIFPSRFIVLTSWLTTLVMVSAGRIVLRAIRDFELKRGTGAHKLVVIVGPKTDSKLIHDIKNSPELGYQVAGIVDSTDPNLILKLEELYKLENLDEVLQADPDFASAKSAELVRFCHDRGVKFNFVPDIFEVSTPRMEVEMLNDTPVIKLKGTPLDGWGRIAKRVVDILLSLLAVIILSPIILLIILLIKLDSRGPVFYSAPRAGLTSDFKFHKFRSMFTHLSVGEGYGGEEAERVRRELATKSERGGPLIKIKQDPRVTRIGRFLRKFKLDEIPQFWNVLRGDMSLVGPRAHVLDEVQAYRDAYKRLFTIKPGVFGLTQLAQLKEPNLPFEEETKLDTYYIENWSLGLDIKIIFQTVWKLLTGKFSTEDY